MPEENKMNTENKDIVDIDTSGPEAEVALKEEKSEKDTDNNIQPVDKHEKLDEQHDDKVEEVQPETETKEQEKKSEEKKEEQKD